MMNRRLLIHAKQITLFLLCLVMTAALIAPIPAAAENTTKNVRVGWYESAFCATDESGRRSGYSYEYQMKIAAYADWDYTYITGSWSDLMQKLIDGEIDLLSDVSYTEERAERMLYPELSMGTEEYVIFISPKNTEITANHWEQVHVSMGFVVYDPVHDNAVIDVVRRADKTMYENKHLRKKNSRQSGM